MAIPPYILTPNTWASMMVQQQAAHAQMAAAQAHAQAHAQAQVVAQAQAAHAHAQMQAVHQLQQAQQPVVPVPMPLPKPPEILTEDKLQEKGLFCLRTEVLFHFSKKGLYNFEPMHIKL